jgi:HlyD family secretion protein
MLIPPRNALYSAFGVGAFVVVALVGGLIWESGGSGPSAAGFETAAVDRGTVEKAISATGAVSALVTVDVSSQLSGLLQDVKVDFNSTVKSQDVLAVIDPQTFQAKVSSAEANLSVARANVEVQQANVAKSEALVSKAERDAARSQELAKRGAVAKAALDATNTALTTAKTDVLVAKAQLVNATAVVAQREADLTQAKLDLERTAIRAPIDGVVIARNVDPGATVAASLQAPVLFQIAQDLSQIQIEAQVDEADIGSVASGNDVTFTVDAYPDQTFNGKVDQVRLAATTANNVVTYTVVIRAENPRQRLLPGMTATVRIVTGRREDALRIPVEALRFRPPEGVAESEQRGGGGQGDRGEEMVVQLTERLGLTEEQQEKLKAAMAERQAQWAERRQGQGGGGQGGGQQSSGDGAGNEQRRQRGAGMERMLAGILTDEQMQKYQEWRSTRPRRGGDGDGGRMATIWIADGSTIEPRRVRAGLSDDRFTEIMGGELKEGDKVVLRASRPRTS